MKITMIRTRGGWEQGETFSLEDHVALSLIEQGFAVALKEEAAAVTPAATPVTANINNKKLRSTNVQRKGN